MKPSYLIRNTFHRHEEGKNSIYKMVSYHKQTFIPQSRFKIFLEITCPLEYCYSFDLSPIIKLQIPIFHKFIYVPLLTLFW